MNEPPARSGVERDGGAGGPTVVACSGGPDSLALAAAARQVLLAEAVLVGAVVDHGLQAGSAGRAEHVADQLTRIGYSDVRVLRAEVVASGSGPEAAAREARYAVLDSLATALDAQVLLGHTRDDQAETVLLGLLRGSGTRSLAGMASRSGRYRRPLLALPRADTVTACAELGLKPWRDPHNTDPSFTRSRLRHGLLTLLRAELGDAVTENLARTADLARADADALDALAAALATTAVDGDGLRCDVLADAEPALRTRVLRRWLLASGASEVAAVHVAAVASLVTDWHGQGPIDVPGLRVHRRDGRLLVAA